MRWKNDSTSVLRPSLNLKHALKIARLHQEESDFFQYAQEHEGGFITIPLHVRKMMRGELPYPNEKPITLEDLMKKD